MRAPITTGIVTLSLAIVITPLQAGDGKTLYEEKCTKCHTTEVFTRKDRSIGSHEALKMRVKQCAGAAEVTWNDDEIQSVTDYLDKNYYKF